MTWTLIMISTMLCSLPAIIFGSVDEPCDPPCANGGTCRTVGYEWYGGYYWYSWYYYYNNNLIDYYGDEWQRCQCTNGFFGTSCEETCGGEINSPDGGVFTSPNYGSKDYPRDTNCEWLITAPEGAQVIIIIEDLDMEYCCDYLTIYDGSDSSADQMALLNGGMPSITAYTSTGNQAYVSFESDYIFTYPGFSARYEIFIPNPCLNGGALTLCPDDGQVCEYTPDTTDKYTCTNCAPPTVAAADGLLCTHVSNAKSKGKGNGKGKGKANGKGRK